MVCSGVDLEFLAHFPAQLVLRQHAPDCRLEYPFRVALHQLCCVGLLEASGPSGVMAVELAVQLVTGKNNLFGIDDYYVIPDVQERGIAGLVLAHEEPGRMGSEPSQSFALGFY